MEQRNSLTRIIPSVFIWFFQVSLLVCQSLTTTNSLSNNASDRLALLSFKSLIHDPQGALVSWNDSLPFCEWQGINCGSRRHPERVTALDLDSLDLAGSLSPSLGNLTFLKRIHLPSNQLQGNIPSELGHLSRLQHLNLSLNYFEGLIPATIMQSPHLRNISLRNNKLEGEISINLPPHLGTNYSLTSLDLSDNRIIGSIPASLGNISSLAYLDLSNNSLTEGIPYSLGKLSLLTYFDVSRNNLTGSFPNSIWNLSLLTEVNVHTNNLSGTLPLDLGHFLPHLKIILMFENQFTGAIPVSISNSSRLEKIQLYYNQFSGKIPWNLGKLQGLSSLILGDNQLEASEPRDWRFFTGLTNCTMLQTLDVSDNMLSGVLPDSISNLSRKLEWLGMKGNQISGSLPSGIANLVSLTEFRIKTNLVTGNIPATIGRLQKLQYLSLAFNYFSGRITPTFGNLTQLNFLYLEGNHLTGNIPTSLENCQNLVLLNLEQNRLTGIIPPVVVSITSLSIYLSFSDNLLTGPLPSEIGKLKSLDALDVSGNKLSGEIPMALGECQGLEYLFLESNLFHGSVPSYFSQLRGLKVLDLSNNNLSGEIPVFLKDFPYLDYLNLSFNKFEGEVPKDGVFGNASIISVFGNSRLCGGVPSLQLPKCPIQTTGKKHRSHSPNIIIVVTVPVVCSVLLLCMFATCYCIRRSRRKASTTAETNDLYKKVTYGELLKATDGFSTINLIGVGSYSSVYRGILGDGGNRTVVAVKVLNIKRRGSTRSFMAECATLRSIRHRNLLKILTVCSSIDFRGNDFRALVFEFMPNGSLEKWLHPEQQEQCEQAGLNFFQRLNIAIDVASALDYLHQHGPVPIVHCDLKPANVLLDSDMVAHVGDFGIARFLDEMDSKSSYNATSSSGLKGTIGYVAPEYGMANKVSTQGDIYSYGIILLEMFTGKRPTDHDFMKGISLQNFIMMVLPDGVVDIIDKRMFLDLEVGEGSDNTQSIFGIRGIRDECLALLNIGLACTQELPSDRMQIGDVVKKLIKIKETLARGTAQ